MSYLNKSDIINGLRKLGLSDGDHVMVHSSLKSFGYVEGGANTVIDAVLETIGSDGTMLLPTNVFQGSVTVFLRDKIRDNKGIDLRVEKSMTGIITETLRNRANSLRSIHPSHPVAAIGKKAEELLSEHHIGDSPAGKKSPYGKLAELDKGKILLLGVTNSRNTSIHTAEEYYSSYIFIGETFDTKVIALDGKTHHVNVKGYCVNTPRDFTALDDELINKSIMSRGLIGNSIAALINSKDLLSFMREEIGKNPLILLSHKNNT
ncbi:MAG TPA: AAC(3) family N-acetyltransferase [Clostridiales bacterium]|nr:AAC(3) family N-acetyltransferase [Clostridiales bacterium]